VVTLPVLEAEAFIGWQPAVDLNGAQKKREKRVAFRRGM